ncbi:ABC transporter substrate-binding protein [Methanophagales archaeon]|nr:MAG: ABC transporter substrate-binding protein [Methanophagales archaeon]
MKKKNKLLTLVGIAVVLCSMFLVALPGVAAEENQTTQKVSASTITTASEDDYVLGIYGNANLDDTVDVCDLTYTERIRFELEDSTALADANYDTYIDMGDVLQEALIILGREKKLTIVDAEGSAKTVSKPIEKIVTLNPDCAEAIRGIGAKDRISGIEGATAKYTKFFPEISQLPSVGMGHTPDLEEILQMNPDILIAYAPGIYNPGHEGLEDFLEPGVTVVRLDFYKPETLGDEMLKLGYLLDEEENAREYVEWHDGYVNEIEDIVSGISEEDKPRVFIDYGGEEGSPERLTCAKGTGNHQLCEKAGGKNIAADVTVPCVSPGYPYVSSEWILEQEPEVIIGQASGYNTREGGYETDDESGMIAYHDEIIGLEGFENLEAVKNNRTYIIQGDVAGGLTYLVGLAYHAKWFHPNLFNDLHPQEIHQEYIDEFCGIDFDVTEHGVFVYYL